MKAAFLTSSLIASKGKATPASPRMAPKNLLDEDKKDDENRVSRIYDRVREYAEPHHSESEEDAPAPTEQTASESFPETAFEEASTDDSPTASSSDSSRAFMTHEIATEEKTETTLNGTAPYERTDFTRPSAQRGYPSVPTSKSAMNRHSNGESHSPLGEEKAKEIAAEVSKLKKDGLGRIRISVRMSPEDHLQLKLIAAHTQMSAQSIFETALEEYVANHGTEILPQSCNCVLDKSSL